MAVVNLGTVPVSKEDIAPLAGVGSDAGAGVLAATSNKVGKTPRLLILVAAVLMIGVYVFPLWNVQLTAPQYPEGLGMHIRINTVEGATENDLDNINNLNHYIGMKRIEPESI